MLRWVQQHRPDYKFNPACLQPVAPPAPAGGLSLKAQLQMQQEEEVQALEAAPAMRPPPLPPHLRPLPPPTPPTLAPPPPTPPTLLAAGLPPPTPPGLAVPAPAPAPAPAPGPALKPPPLPPSLAGVLRLYTRKTGISKGAQHQCQRSLHNDHLRREVLHSSFVRMMDTAKSLQREGTEALRCAPIHHPPTPPAAPQQGCAEGAGRLRVCTGQAKKVVAGGWRSGYWAKTAAVGGQKSGRWAPNLFLKPPQNPCVHPEAPSDWALMATPPHPQHLDTPGQRRGPLPSSVWTRRRAVKQAKVPLAQPPEGKEREMERER